MPLLVVVSFDSKLKKTNRDPTTHFSWGFMFFLLYFNYAVYRMDEGKFSFNQMKYDERNE